MFLDLVFMDRQITLQHLAEAERHVSEEHETIQRQRQIVATLSATGPTAL